MDIEQLAHSTGSLKSQLNVVPVLLEASFSAWETSLICDHFRSAMFSEQEGSLKRVSGKFLLDSFATYSQDVFGWEIKGGIRQKFSKMIFWRMTTALSFFQSFYINYFLSPFLCHSASSIFLRTLQLCEVDPNGLVPLSGAVPSHSPPYVRGYQVPNSMGWPLQNHDCLVTMVLLSWVQHAVVENLYTGYILDAAFPGIVFCRH